MADEMGIFEVMFNCRAMRRIKPDAVPEDLLRRLIEAAHQAPTASNGQNTRWIIVRDAEQKQKLADLNREARRVAYGSPPPATDPAMARRQRASKWHTDNLQDVPVHVVACLEFETAPVDSFARGVGTGGSVWPAVQNLLLAARALGLGAVPTTLPLADRAAAKEVLGLPEHVEPYCLIPVGYPMGNFGPVTRRPIDEILRWDRW
ncbi:MAG: nitroreductase family protein [Dehalococcoidia bacterium]